jgi:hypothetical protein
LTNWKLSQAILDLLQGLKRVTTSEWISVLALMISSGGFALQARNWWTSAPRLHLSIMGDAIIIPDDHLGDRLALTVINRGPAPTVLTHMVVFAYASLWKRFRKKPGMTGVVSATHIPFKLDTNATWTGFMLYNSETNDHRTKGHLYVGVIAAHRERPYLIRVPPPKQSTAPTNVVAKGG